MQKDTFIAFKSTLRPPDCQRIGAEPRKTGVTRKPRGRVPKEGRRGYWGVATGGFGLVAAVADEVFSPRSFFAFRAHSLSGNSSMMRE
jgi:hypothetical protein